MATLEEFAMLCEVINSLRAAGLDPLTALLVACAEVF
jgi:hypothetical protein